MAKKAHIVIQSLCIHSSLFIRWLWSYLWLIKVSCHIINTCERFHGSGVRRVARFELFCLFFFPRGSREMLFTVQWNVGTHGRDTTPSFWQIWMWQYLTESKTTHEQVSYSFLNLSLHRANLITNWRSVRKRLRVFCTSEVKRKRLRRWVVCCEAMPLGQIDILSGIMIGLPSHQSITRQWNPRLWFVKRR